MDRRQHLLVRAAAADIGDVGVDVVLNPGLLHLVQRAVLRKPLMVVICLPSTVLTGTEHDRVAAPST